jgi:hypothetical protein
LEGISDIRIVGIDEKRPPQVRKAPYIDLFYELSHQAPKDWCDDFNDLAKRLVPPAKINAVEGLFVEAWVRDMELIPAHLEEIKKKIVACNERYIEKIRRIQMASAELNASSSNNDTRQGRLNAILARLTFDA